MKPRWAGPAAAGGASGPVGVPALAWTLFAAVVGGGFASGQELRLFFGGCGSASVGWALGAGLAIGLATSWLMASGGPGGLASGAMHAGPEVSRRATARRYGTAVAAAAWRVVPLWLSLASLSTMSAALAHLGEGAGMARWVALGMSVAALAAGALVPATRGLARISLVLGPFVALVVAAERALWLLQPPPPPQASFLPGAGMAPLLLPTMQAAVETGLPRPPGGGCFVSLLIYAASNALFAVRPVTAVAAGLRPGPEAWRTRWIGGLVGGLLLGSVAAAGMGLVQHVPTERPMPLLEAAYALSPTWGGLHTTAMVAAIYTTGVAALVGLAHGEPTGSPVGTSRRRRLSWVARTLIWSVAAIPLAAAGFEAAVAYLYPVSGWLALGVVAATLFARGRRPCLY